MAETMLHRTQVAQVVPVFQEFITKYPDISSLAKASHEELRSVLFSLGLQWRIDLIYQMVQQIAEHFALQIPQEKADLLSLPGVSEYIAGAVRCFSWNLPDVLTDTNTVRIVGRVMGWEVRDSSRRNSQFRQMLQLWLDPVLPGAFNYALIDLAHLACVKRQQPHCEICPVMRWCHYGSRKGCPYERS